MYWPGVTAAARDRAGTEAEPAPGERAAGVNPAAPITPVPPPRGPRGGTLTRAGAARVPELRPMPHLLPCREDPELFFAEAPADVETAKAMCGHCPTRAGCLAGALQRQEPWGVWGGELVLRGEVVPRKRPRGRPRKTEVAA